MVENSPKYTLSKVTFAQRYCIRHKKALQQWKVCCHTKSLPAVEQPSRSAFFRCVTAKGIKIAGRRLLFHQPSHVPENGRLALISFCGGVVGGGLFNPAVCPDHHDFSLHFQLRWCHLPFPGLNAAFSTCSINNCFHKLFIGIKAFRFSLKCCDGFCTISWRTVKTPLYNYAWHYKLVFTWKFKLSSKIILWNLVEKK